MTHPLHGLRNDVYAREFQAMRASGWVLRMTDIDFAEIVRLQAWFFQTKHFPQLKWHLLRVPAGNHFIIGDRPVLWGWQNWNDPPPGALKERGVQLLAPLTRSLALLGCHAQDEPARKVYPADVNRAMLAGARRWIAGPSEQLLRNLLRTGAVRKDHLR
jgi:hypothetical protein